MSWGALGHMLTARIAEITLNNNNAYLNAQTHALAINSLTNGKSNTFMESACWPDDLRS